MKGERAHAYNVYTYIYIYMTFKMNKFKNKTYVTEKNN